MIYDSLENLEKYVGVHPRFAKAIPFLKELIATDPEKGRHDMPDGDVDGAVYANVNAYDTNVLSESSQMEVHRKYIDIQIILEGEETIYLPALETLHTTKAYDVGGDYELMAMPSPDSCVTLNLPKGSFAIFFAVEPHAPNHAVSGKSTFVRKVVGKVLE
ncbi:MAG: YhcH/YjgK/YiaL family protein [Clostridia bacterium]|nr:YhcH/YjgK/YiaL family protein [Clostridia bacterium]